MTISAMTWPQIVTLVVTAFALRALGLSIGGALGRSRPLREALAVMPLALVVCVVVSLTVDIAQRSPEPRPAVAGIVLGAAAIGARLSFITTFLLVIATAVVARILI